MSRPVPKGDPPPHGHANRYVRWHCRCTPCTRAASRADAERRLDRLAGRSRKVSAEACAAHIAVLVAAGLSQQQIADAAGVWQVTVSRIRSGQRHVSRLTQDAILAVPVGCRPMKGQVSSVGAVRRLRALYALGHFARDIAERSGLSKDAVADLVAGRPATLDASRDAAVRACFDELSMKVGGSAKTRLRAQAEGWVPPLAWDEDAIDDPAAVPHVDAAAAVPESGERAVARWLAGESVVLSQSARAEVVGHLMEWSSLSSAEIGVRLGVSTGAVEKQWERLVRRARVEGRPVPWRRVSRDRNRMLKQSEMGEAA
ncbi:hypothetical protein GA0115250_144745 [Streptomyces sp. BvitLS-983]|nr:hypothetical protein GA0115250_144745 [Streptomyces sp. BvitLS-983]